MLFMAGTVAVTLLRHGLTEANERKEYLGWSDSPLTDRARKGLERDRRLYRNSSRVYSSDLGRCLETAGILFPHAECIPNKLYREMNFGKWEGRTYRQLADDPHYRLFLEAPFEADIPSGEGYPAFSARIIKAWGELCKDSDVKPGAEIAIITHGGVIRELLHRITPNPGSYWEWNIRHGAGFRLEWENIEQWRSGAACTSLQEEPVTARPNG